LELEGLHIEAAIGLNGTTDIGDSFFTGVAFAVGAGFFVGLLGMV
jgi:hypothetical protein